MRFCGSGRMGRALFVGMAICVKVQYGLYIYILSGHINRVLIEWGPSRGVG